MADFTTMSPPTFAIVLYTMIAASLGQEEQCTYSTEFVPYITFMGEQLPNHSYVHIHNILNGSNKLQCRTDLATCCNPSADRPVTHTGQWVLPNGVVVDQSVSDYIFREGDQQIDLDFEGTRESAITGMYRCDMPTNSVNDTANVARESVYVGLFEDGQCKLRYTIEVL